MNVVLLLVICLCIPILFTGSKTDTETIKTFLIFLTAGLGFVAAANYIFFGMLTLWHKSVKEH